MAKKIRIEDYKEMEKKSKAEIKIKDKLKLISLVANGILLIGIIVLIVLYVTQTVSKDEYDSMLNIKNSRINTLEARASNLDYLLDGQSLFYVKEKLEFFDENIVFKIKGYGNYYYTYDCMMNKVNGSYTYWGYNKEAAISEGLKKGGC